jgi:hypothetical protein
VCRFRGREGSDVRVGPPREVGAVELALRNSSTRKTRYILEPVVGTSFDSLAEAHEFYNLYSWEVGFGIRYGKNYTNGKKYRSSQVPICQMEVQYIFCCPQQYYMLFFHTLKIESRPDFPLFVQNGSS